MDAGPFSAVLAQARQLQELAKQLSPGRQGQGAPALAPLAQCLCRYKELASEALDNCKTPQDLWKAFPRAFPASLHSIWEWLQAWVCSEQPLQAMLEAAASITDCLENSKDLFVRLLEAHHARQPDISNPAAAGKQDDTPLDAILRKGSVGFFYVALSQLCLRLTGLPAAASDCRSLNVEPCLHEEAHLLDLWQQVHPLLQIADSMIRGLHKISWAGMITTVQHYEALLDITSVACTYSQHCIVNESTAGSTRGAIEHERLLGRLGSQGTVVAMTSGLNETLYNVLTRIADALVCRLQKNVKLAELQRPDGAKLGTSAAARLEACTMTCLVRVLRLLLLCHLTWQQYARVGMQDVHISFFSFFMDHLVKLCWRQTWPQQDMQGWDQQGRQQQRQQQQQGQQQEQQQRQQRWPDSQLSADEAQCLLQALHAVAWSVLRVSSSNVKGDRAHASPWQLARAHSHAAQLLWFVHERRLLVQAPPIGALDILNLALASEHADAPCTESEVCAAALALCHLLPVMATAAAHEVQQQQQQLNNSQLHAERDSIRSTVPPVVLRMLEGIRQGVSCVAPDPCGPPGLNLEALTPIIPALQKATVILLLTDYMGLSAAAAGRRRFPEACALLPCGSVWAQAPGLYRAASLHLLPAFALAGEACLLQWGAEYVAACKAEDSMGADGLNPSQQRKEQRSVQTVLTLMSTGITAALTGIITICWPALLGSAGHAFRPWGGLGDAGSDSAQGQCHSPSKQHERHPRTQSPLLDLELDTSGSAVNDDPIICQSYAHDAIQSLCASNVMQLLQLVAEAAQQLLPAASDLLHPDPVTPGGRATGDKKEKQEREQREAAWREQRLVHQATAALTVISLVQHAAQCTEVLVMLSSQATHALSDCIPAAYESEAALMDLVLFSWWTYSAVAGPGILQLLSSKEVIQLLHFPWGQPAHHPPDWSRYSSLQPLLQQLGATAAPDLLTKVLASITNSLCCSAPVIAAAAEELLEGKPEQSCEPSPEEQPQQARQPGRQAEHLMETAAAADAQQPHRGYKIPVVNEDSDDDAGRSESCSPPPHHACAEEANCRQPQGEVGVAVEAMLRQAADLSERLVPACAELALQHRAMLRPKRPPHREVGAATGCGLEGQGLEAACADMLSSPEACTSLSVQAQQVVKLYSSAARAAWCAIGLAGSVLPLEAAGGSGEGVSSNGSHGRSAKDAAELAWHLHSRQLDSSDWGKVAQAAYEDLGGRYTGCNSRSCPFVVARNVADQATCPMCKDRFCCLGCMQDAFEAMQHGCWHKLSSAQLAEFLSMDAAADTASSRGSNATWGLGINGAQGEAATAGPRLEDALAASYDSETGASDWLGTLDDMLTEDTLLNTEQLLELLRDPSLSTQEKHMLQEWQRKVHNL